MEEELTEVFVFVDDFCKVFESKWDRLKISSGINTRIRRTELCLSELMTILIFFHKSGFKSLKKFYIFLLKSHKKEFPNLVSYNRFIELEKTCVMPLLCLFFMISAPCDGQSYIDSTALPVCHIKRELSHKTFSGIATKSKTTMGWFFGFKLHMVVNKYGHPISFSLTKANVDDRKAPDDLFQKIFGKLYGDKGYLGKEFFDKLKEKATYVVTSIRKNMKPQILTDYDSQNLNKRSIIETVFNVLKKNLNLDHTRHRSPVNFVVNVFSSICAYCLRFLSNFSILKKDNLLNP
jgi:hypothetical protein